MKATSNILHAAAMNDLNGLDWSAKPGTGQRPVNGQGNYSAFSTLRPAAAPTSGRASPLAETRPPSTLKSATPAGDSFSNLVSFSTSNPNKNLSLQEQQKLREASKSQQSVGQKQKLQDQWVGNDDVWNNLGSGRSTPAAQASDGMSHVAVTTEEDDLFSAFNKPAPIKPASSKKSQPQTKVGPEDDDPFGLAEFQAQSAARARVGETGSNDDEDILGDLGKPFVEKPKVEQRRALPRKASPEPQQETRSDHPQDKAVAELVDMGFPAEKARRALEATDTGMNVQAAVGLLLNQAHEEARQKSRGREQTPQTEFNERPRRQQAPTGESQHERGNAQRDRSSTPSNDPAKAAQEFGAAFMKSAGAFWKTAQKQVQQAVSEFNSDSESGASTPKWMREAAGPQRQREEDVEIKGKQTPRQQQQQQQQSSTATDEALMLESERPTPPPRSQPRARPEHVFEASTNSSRDHSPAMPSRLRESHSPQPAFMKQQDPLASMMRPKPREAPRSAREVLNKQAADDQASQAYVSSNRRRKPATPVSVQAEGDLLEGAFSRAAPVTQSLPVRPVTKSAPPAKPTTPIATRPPPPMRNIPQISTIALKASHTARSQGNNSFKRGDYSAAHEAYSTSLRHIPNAHPLQIVLLTNRALTALKTGQPKLAVVDADTAITVIGISKGEAETIDVQDDDGQTATKPMRDYYGKALMRKAEALENLERWSEAAAVWRLCVEDGHGGATAIQGRARAEKAAAPKPTAAPVRKPPARTAARSTPSSTKPAAAVSALRAQNQAAEKLDDEKFALADVVSARITAWKGGKEGNLRALLASLDTVLWEGAGWKKIGMADLVLPNKVKINYMKGIGKCHPDKVSFSRSAVFHGHPRLI